MRETLQMFRLLAAAVLLAMAGGCGGGPQPETPAGAPAPPAAAPPAAAAVNYTVETVTGGGVVEGRVLLEGTPPAPRRVEVTQDSATCGRVKTIPALRVAGGGIDEAVVWIDDITRGKPFAFPPARITQKDCDFLPRVSVTAPDDVVVDSQDPIPHNVHTYSDSNREYNESMNQLRSEITLAFPRPDRVSVRCDLHGWMQAYVIVASNPYYAVTANGGRFRLEDVPPGNYRLKVWSETLGESEQAVTVQAGQPVQVNFTLRAETARAEGSR